MSIASLNPKESSQCRWTQHSSGLCSFALQDRLGPLWCIVRMSYCSPTLPSSLSPYPKGSCCLFLLSTLSKDTDLPFHLLSVLLLCPPATLSLVWANLSHGVEQLPTRRGCFQQHLPSPCLTLAPRLSSPLVSQFKRIVFCWINKLDRLTVWFDVVQERVWTSRARSQGGKSRTTQVRTVSWLSRVMKLHPYLLRII